MEKRLFSNRQLMMLIVPLIIEQLLSIMVGFVDTVMVSQVGEAAVSAVSLVDSINLLLINVFMALGTGGAVVASQYVGQGSKDKARYSAKQLIIVTFLFSVVISILCLIGNRALLKLVFGDVEESVMSNCLTYFFFSVLSYPFIAMFNSGAALFRTMGKASISMVNSLIMNVMNIILNAFFIFVMNMGVAGVAMATLISRITGCLIVLYLLTNRSNDLYIEDYIHLKPDFSYIKKILTIGIPTGLENGVFQLGKIMVASLVSTFGTYAIAANAVTSNLAQFIIVPGQAIGLAMVSVVGICVGADDYDQAKYYIRKLLLITHVLMIITTIVIIGFMPLILTLYSLSQEAISLASKILHFYALFAFWLWPISFTFPNALRASNDARFTMIVSFTSMFLFRYVLSIILGKYVGMGLFGVWIAMITDWFVRSSFFIYRYKSGQWMNRQLI